MTEVAFHFNAPDKLVYACRLLRKATGSGAQVVVTGETSFLQELDAALWNLAPHEFLAHGMEGCPDAVWQQSPVVLASSVQDTPHHNVLVNLGQDVPDGFSRFERLIEVISAEDAADRDAARARWKHYADRGYAITRHDLAQKRGAA